MQGQVPGIQIYFTFSSRGARGLGGTAEAGGQHTSVSLENMWDRLGLLRPTLPGHYSSRTDAQPRPRAWQPLGRGGLFGKTSRQALNAKEVLHPSPISLPSPAGSRKANAGKLE